MQPMCVAAGATIFHAGEPSLAVYVVRNGEVAITVGDAAAPVEVARVRAGELFGKSGVLEVRPRVATATAVTATTLLVTEAALFIRAFGLDNDHALFLVKLLCHRLRRTTQRRTTPRKATQRSTLQRSSATPRGARPEEPDLPASRTAATQAAPAAIRLVPGHERLFTEYGMGPIDVRRVPFQIGNRYGGETLPITSDRNCCIPAHGEIDLAAPHFEILRRGGRLGVRDLGSRHGTIVNGAVVTGASVDTFVPLQVGENDVIAGRANSPFRFHIQVRGG